MSKKSEHKSTKDSGKESGDDLTPERYLSLSRAQLSQILSTNRDYRPPERVQSTVTPTRAKIDKADGKLVLTLESKEAVESHVEIIFEGAAKDPQSPDAVQRQARNTKLKEGTQQVDVPVPQYWLDSPGSRRVTVHIELTGIRDPQVRKSRHTIAVPGAE